MATPDGWPSLPVALLAGSAWCLARDGTRGCTASCPLLAKPRSGQRTRRAAPPPTGPGDRRSGGARDAARAGADARSRGGGRAAAEGRAASQRAETPTDPHPRAGAEAPQQLPQAPPAKNGRDRRDGRRERAGRPQAPEGPDKGPGREKARAGGDADKDRTPTCARGGGPGSGSAQPGRPDEPKPRGATHRSARKSEGAGAKGARPPTEHDDRRPAGQGARAAPARQRTGRAANGHPQSRPGPTSAERAQAVVSSRRRPRTVRPEAAQTATAERPERKQGGAAGRITPCALLTASQIDSDGGGGMIPFLMP